VRRDLAKLATSLGDRRSSKVAAQLLRLIR
jgi:hypothetical protein